MPFSLLRMLASATALVFLTLPVFGQISINEIVAEARDQEGHLLPDWVELSNTGNQSVNLAGYSLTDNSNTPRKWIFPSNVNIPANGFRRIPTAS